MGRRAVSPGLPGGGVAAAHHVAEAGWLQTEVQQAAPQEKALQSGIWVILSSSH